ncbi:YdcH family protein [Pseudomonas sp. zbq_18]|uniref:YdcH family protein n=1 Tax=Pseudomonadota TaxID=1224 RepID=UPI00370B5FCA
MPLEHHPLTREFPEYRQQLQALYAQDAHFSRLAQQYESLDKRIYEVEDGREALDDLALHALKNERVQLKDKIAERLRTFGADA